MKQHAYFFQTMRSGGTFDRKIKTICILTIKIVHINIMIFWYED